MTYGFERGPGRRGGMGFGFCGASPPWPYVGRGRGGLPRCGYYLGSPTPSVAWAGREQEINFLRSQSEALGRHLNDIETRIKDLEANAEK
jgi:hypothetical protein